jgi:neural Wiskott-Aldrich syndrome protein
MPQSFADQLRSIPMSPNLGQSLERAHRCARDQSHRLVTLEHLLLALTEDAEAALILQSANVDLARLGTDVSGHLGRLMEDMRVEPGAEPRPDAELLRVLQAAASAAQQSRRKQIDGAIVLAAIVGDGKSPAAGLLKALGMTFEEAIRALQRANTKARLKPLAKAPSAAAVPPAEAPTMPAPADAGSEPDAARPAPSLDVPITEPGSPMPEPLATQSADEILAAARARIQKRAAAAVRTDPVILNDPPPAPPPEPAGAASLPMDVDPLIEPVDPVQAKSLTAAIEAAMATPHSRGAEPLLPPTAPSATTDRTEEAQPAPSAPQPPAAARPARGTRTPPPEPRPQAPARAPQPALGRAPPMPFPARPLQPHEGPRRPPLPPRAAPPHGQPQPGFPNRPARAPWPEPGERGAGARPPLANGSYAELPLPPQQAPDRPGPAVRPGQRGGVPGEKGLLIEAVPRRMRVGVPTTAEVRIARDKIDGLLAALDGRDPSASADSPLARALSVCLRATRGGFWIESTTPETQWIEAGPARADDEYIAWRWTVVPRRRGRGRLTLMVAAHKTGRDGVVAQASPPDRVIDVRIRANQIRRAFWMTGWIAAALAGAAAARFVADYWPLASAVIKKALGD